MAPRPALPADDLYRRLGVAVDASPRPSSSPGVHCSVATTPTSPATARTASNSRSGSTSPTTGWRDPALRARYDRERRPSSTRSARAVTARRDVAGPRRGPATAPGGTAPPPGLAAAPRPGGCRRRFLARVAALTPDGARPVGARRAAADRVPGDGPPLPPAGGGWRHSPRSRRAGAADVPPGADRPVIREALDGYAAELVLAPFLDELLAANPSAAGQGSGCSAPGTLASASRGSVPTARPWTRSAPRRRTRIRPARGAGRVRGRRIAGETVPGPEHGGGRGAPDLGAARGPGRGGGRAREGLAPRRSRARRMRRWWAHVTALRHAFPPAIYAALVAPWRPLTGGGARTRQCTASGRTCAARAGPRRVRSSTRGTRDRDDRPCRSRWCRCARDRRRTDELARVVRGLDADGRRSSMTAAGRPCRTRSARRRTPST